jgi:hypothetical protein
MRAIFFMSAMALIGLSEPAAAECFGKYPAMTCVSNSGDVWTPQGYYSSYSDKDRGSKIARSPSAGGGSWHDDPATQSGTGKTELLQPSAQTGNAWVVAPATNNGATVLGGAGSTGTCESGASC